MEGEFFAGFGLGAAGLHGALAFEFEGTVGEGGPFVLHGVVAGLGEALGIGFVFAGFFR